MVCEKTANKRIAVFQVIELLCFLIPRNSNSDLLRLDEHNLSWTGGFVKEKNKLQGREVFQFEKREDIKKV